MRIVTIQCNRCRNTFQIGMGYSNCKCPYCGSNIINFQQPNIPQKSNNKGKGGLIVFFSIITLITVITMLMSILSAVEYSSDLKSGKQSNYSIIDKSEQEESCRKAWASKPTSLDFLEYTINDKGELLITDIKDDYKDLEEDLDYINGRYWIDNNYIIDGKTYKVASVDIELNDNKINSIIISDGIKHIDGNCISSDNKKERSIYLPSSLSSNNEIDNIIQCSSDDKDIDIYFGGTFENWVLFAQNIDNNDYSLYHMYYDSKIVQKNDITNIQGKEYSFDINKAFDYEYSIEVSMDEDAVNYQCDNDNISIKTYTRNQYMWTDIDDSAYPKYIETYATNLPYKSHFIVLPKGKYVVDMPIDSHNDIQLETDEYIKYSWQASGSTIHDYGGQFPAFVLCKESDKIYHLSDEINDNTYTYFSNKEGKSYAITAQNGYEVIRIDNNQVLDISTIKDLIVFHKIKE